MRRAVHAAGAFLTGAAVIYAGLTHAGFTPADASRIALAWPYWGARIIGVAARLPAHLRKGR